MKISVRQVLLKEAGPKEGERSSGLNYDFAKNELVRSGSEVSDKLIDIYYKQNKDSLFLAYDGIISRSLFDKIMQKVQYGGVNEFPAKNMLLFHQVTKAITYLIPFFLGILILLTLFKQKVPAKIIKKTASRLKYKEKKVELTE